MFHCCFFHRLPMGLINKDWNQEGNFPGFVCLFVCFFQFALIPSIAIVQQKITGYLQGNVEFLRLQFPPGLCSVCQCSHSIFTGSRVPTTWLYSICKQLRTENVWFSVWKAYWFLWHSWSQLGTRKKVPHSGDLDKHLHTFTHWSKWKLKSSGLKNWEIRVETFIHLVIYVWKVLAWMYEVLAGHTVTC